MTRIKRRTGNAATVANKGCLGGANGLESMIGQRGWLRHVAGL
jgi:hypothetical protein